MKYNDSIYNFVTQEENSFQTLPIRVAEGWEWSFADHVRKTLLYLNSQFTRGNSDNERDHKPFKNVIRPIINLQARAEGFDVKDIQLYIDSAKDYFKSFLVKKYHEKWAIENNVDQFIDDFVETWIAYGGVLIKKAGNKIPEVVPFHRLAFCDQTNIMTGVICEKHFYSSDELKAMVEKGWENIDEVISHAENTKDVPQTPGYQSKTPGKYIEVYELHGSMPLQWLEEGNEEGNTEENKYERQMHVITFYSDKENKKGISLFCGKEKKTPYKFFTRDKIFGRGLGFGAVEELFESQVWVNYDMIRIKGMLDAASKVIYQTSDKKVANANKNIGSLTQGEIIIHAPNEPVNQVNTFPVNIRVFENSIKEWEEHARQMGAAQEAIMGDEPPAGTPFKSVEFQAIQSHSLHKYRQGKLAKYVEEVYRDWILPAIVNEMSNEQEFLSELDLDELREVSENVIKNEMNKFIKDLILRGELPDQFTIAEFKERIRSSFMGSSKKFIKILKDEMRKLPISLKINIAGKQKYLAAKVDKLVNIFRTVVANPAILQNPSMAKLFNQIIESSGLDPIDFSGFQVSQNTPQGGETAPLSEISSAERSMTEAVV